MYCIKCMRYCFCFNLVSVFVCSLFLFTILLSEPSLTNKIYVIQLQGRILTMNHVSIPSNYMCDILPCSTAFLPLPKKSNLILQLPLPCSV